MYFHAMGIIIFLALFVLPIPTLIWAIRGVKSGNPARRNLAWISFALIGLVLVLLYCASGVDLNTH